MIIYEAKNKVNGKRYVGQTVRTLDYRKNGHRRAAKRGEEGIFYAAIRKYGFESFQWRVLEECGSKRELSEREVYWIRELGSLKPDGYNFAEGDGDYKLYTVHREDCKCPFCERKRGKQHKADCRCAVCKNRRGEKHEDGCGCGMCKMINGGFDYVEQGRKMRLYCEEHPEVAARIVGRIPTEEQKIKIGISGKRYYQEHPERAKKHSVWMKEYFKEHPELALNVSVRMNLLYLEHPERRVEIGDRVRRYWVERKQRESLVV